MPNKSKSKRTVKLELFLGNSESDQLETLTELKDSISEVFINLVSEEDQGTTLTRATVRQLTAIYMEADAQFKAIKQQA